MKKLQHLIEAGALYLLFTAFRMMPLDTASWLGGFLARAIGPALSAHQTARKNLTLIFPKMEEGERRRILERMWDNLGRVAAELPHLPGKTLIERITVIGAKHFPKADAPALFFSGHLGNWELLPSVSLQHNTPVALAYRKANNPHVDEIIATLRETKAAGMFPKGQQGGFKLARALKSGQSLAMLVDQKMNDGIVVPFFGHEAMTAPALAQMALRFDMPIIPARVVRTKGAHFETYIYPPLAIEKSGDAEKDTLTIMTAVNRLLESWIREHPEQWFWVHQRWPKHVVE